MDSGELKKEIGIEGSPYVLIDVRETDEMLEEPFSFSMNDHILPLPLTTLMVIPKEEMVARLEDAARRVGKPVSELRLVTACRSGNRSRLAQGQLLRFGISAENLEGGRNVWGDPL